MTNNNNNEKTFNLTPKTAIPKMIEAFNNNHLGIQNPHIDNCQYVYKDGKTCCIVGATLEGVTTDDYFNQGWGVKSLYNDGIITCDSIDRDAFINALYNLQTIHDDGCCYSAETRTAHLKQLATKLNELAEKYNLPDRCLADV